MLARVRGGGNMTTAKSATSTLKSTKKYKTVYNDLTSQLKTNGTEQEYCIDLVKDYMALWVTKELLIKDIETRGVNIEYNNGGGQSGLKKNDSVKDLATVNSQMLRLLNELGLKPTDVKSGADEL